MPSTFADRAQRFYARLARPAVRRGVHVMNPYSDPRVRRYTRAFLDKYFADNSPRVLVFGINPGRFGAGITGITFTDPVALADICGIPNTLQKKRELSSIFIYDFIEKFGGPEAFYARFFLTAASPLGFTQRGVNLNYYDTPDLKRRVTPFIISSIEKHIALGGRTDHAIVLGCGQNATYLTKLNATHRWFGAIHALEHPRFILQYRRRRVDEYLAKYVALCRRLSATS